jgi:tetratricopeptide (TPR) repeat protein
MNPFTAQRVRLCLFGALRLETVRSESVRFETVRADGGCVVQGVSPLQLLMLAFVKLEGSRPRRELAALFWPHLDGQFTRKAERKDLANLGVMRAVLKRKFGFDLDELGDLSCDATLCRRAFEGGDFEGALALLRGGAFLEQLEGRSRAPSLGVELEAWVARQRDAFNALRLAALLGLAEARVREGDAATARALVLEASADVGMGSDAAHLPRLRQLCASLGVPLPAHWQAALTASYEEWRFRLSEAALNLYLILSLQPQPNFVAASRAADLSTRAATAALEELIGAKLVDVSGRPLMDVASDHLEAHPTERLHWLNALREHTPLASALGLYRAIFAATQSFGGIGYWERARGLYQSRASSLLESDDFNATCELLTEWRNAEQISARPPDPQNRFLLAYALERLKRYPEGLEVLQGVPETPEVQAIKSALLLRNAPVELTRAAAESVLSGADPLASDWARAIALNTLGQIAYDGSRWLEAEVLFDQAQVTWSLARHAQREIGAMMNRAVVLEKLARITEARRVYDDVLGRASDDSMRVRALVNLGYTYESVDDWESAHSFYAKAQQLCRASAVLTGHAALHANVLNNLGYAEFKLGRSDAARAILNEAMAVSLHAGQRFWYAPALGNLALVERSVGKFEMALELFRELGVPNYLAQYSALFETMLQDLLAEARAAPSTFAKGASDRAVSARDEQIAFYERKLEGVRAQRRVVAEADTALAATLGVH